MKRQARTRVRILMPAVLALTLVGCATFESGSDRQVREQHTAMTLAQLNNRAEAQNAEIERLRRDVLVLAQDRETLARELRTSHSNYKTLADGYSNLQERLNLVERRLAAIDSEYQRLHSTLSAESQARQRAIEEVVSNVSEKIATTANELERRQRELVKTMGSSGQGEYTVQRGDTLSAIAQAFGVKVSALKRANNLSNDLIREGQKLIIPSP
jgi:LysM repeat protein